VPGDTRLLATDDSLLLATDDTVTAVSPGFGTVGSSRRVEGLAVLASDDGVVVADPGTGRAATFDRQLLQQACGEVDPALDLVAAGPGLSLHRDGDDLVATRLRGSAVWRTTLPGAVTGASVVARGALVTTADRVLLIDTIRGDVRASWDVAGAAIVDVEGDTALVAADGGGALLDLATSDVAAVDAEVPTGLLDGRVLVVDDCTVGLSDGDMVRVGDDCSGITSAATTGNGFTALALARPGSAATVLIFGPGPG
jgi:hypothetical protein